MIVGDIAGRYSRSSGGRRCWRQLNDARTQRPSGRSPHRKTRLQPIVADSAAFNRHSSPRVPGWRTGCKLGFARTWERSGRDCPCFGKPRRSANLVHRSFMPIEVIAGVPSRTPLVTNGTMISGHHVEVADDPSDARAGDVFPGVLCARKSRISRCVSVPPWRLVAAAQGDSASRRALAATWAP